MPSRTVSVTGKGVFYLFPLERQAPFLSVYCSVVSSSQAEYFNFRVPVPRSFYGYVQTFEGQAVIETKALEYQSQLVWRNVDDVQLVFFRICQLGDYIRQINTGLKPGFSASFNSFGVSLAASFPDGFPEYQALLFTENPEGIAYSIEPNAEALFTVTYEELPAQDCFTESAPFIAPNGCGSPGTPPTNLPPGCLPSPPGGGSSS